MSTSSTTVGSFSFLLTGSFSFLLASASFITADLTADPTWIVDPLDGTTNFVHGYNGILPCTALFCSNLPSNYVCSSHPKIVRISFCSFPFVCVSIGLTIGKIPTVGVVFNPIMNEVL